MCVLQVSVLSPCFKDEVTVHVLCTVELLVLESRVPYPRQIVQDNTRFHNDLDNGGGVMLYGSKQNLKAIRQDAKGIFNLPLARESL